MPLHQSYQRQVLNMKCFTPQFASGKIKNIYLFVIFFLSWTQTNKSGDFCLLNQEDG